MKLFTMACYSFLVFSACNTRTNNVSSEVSGNDQVTKVESDTRRGGFLWLKKFKTGNIDIKCNGTGTMTLSPEEYDLKRANGTLCPSAPVAFEATTQSCNLSFGGTTSSSLSLENKFKMKKEAFAKCQEFGATACEIDDISTSCFDAPITEISSPSAIIMISRGACYSFEGVTHALCNHTLTVKGMSPDTNAKPNNLPTSDQVK